MLKLPGKKSFGVMSINSVNIGMAKSVRNDLYPHFTIFRHTNLKNPKKSITSFLLITLFSTFNVQKIAGQGKISNAYLPEYQ